MAHVNPYAPPIDDGPPPGAASFVDSATVDPATERTRRHHLTAETNIKAIGSLTLLGAAIMGAMTIVAVTRAAFVEFAVLLGFAALLGFAGFKLRRLEPVGRLTYTGIVTLSLLLQLAMVGTLEGGPSIVANLLVPALFLWILWNAKGQVVFSQDYRFRVIPATPHIKYKTSRFVLVTLVVLVGLFVVAVVAALVR